MPHDRDGNLLKAGDIVSVSFKVVQVNEGEDFCNCTLESIEGRKPDGAKERVSSINTAVTVLVEKGPDQVPPPEVV